MEELLKDILIIMGSFTIINFLFNLKEWLIYEKNKFRYVTTKCTRV